MAKWCLSDPAPTSAPSQKNPVLGFFGWDETQPNPTPGQGSVFILFFGSHPLTFNGQFVFPSLTPPYLRPTSFFSLPSSLPSFSRS
jgi:hypothetical protein